MRTSTATSTNELSICRELTFGALLLGVSVAAAWLAEHAWSVYGTDSAHLRLLIVMLVHPFAMAAAVFCGLPGLGFTVSSIVRAVQSGLSQNPIAIAA